jgi:hypothetical protein
LSRAFCGGSKIAKIKIIKKNRWNTFFISNPLPIFTVYCTISPDLKQRALYLLLEEGWEIDQITTALGVHSKSIERWSITTKIMVVSTLPPPYEVVVDC